MGITNRICILILTAVTAYSCSSTRVVKTLDKGEHSLGGTFGGAVISFAGAPIPLPLTSVQYAAGLDTGITFHAGWHTTSALFGVAQVEAGLALQAYRSQSARFGATITPTTHLLFDFYENNFRAYPQLEATAWWQYSQRPHLVYGGLGTWVELSGQKAHWQPQENELLPWVTVGHQFVRPLWRYQLELRYLGFQHDNQNLVVDYVVPGSKGAMGIYFGVSRRIGG